MYKSIPTNLPSQSQSHSPNYYSRIVQLTRLETTRGSTSLFFILVTLSSTFTYKFPAHILFSTHPCRCHKPLTHPVDHPKRKQIFSLFVVFPSRNPPQMCVIVNFPTILLLDSITTISHNNNPHTPHTTQNGQVYTIHRMDRAKTFEYNV